MREHILLDRYLSAQLKHAEAYLRKTGCDSDPENLHHYRVALRRTFSVMSVYTLNTDRLKKVLKPLLRSTNRLREIDVLVASLEPERYPILFNELQNYRRTLYEQTWDATAVALQFHGVHELQRLLKTVDLKVPPERFRQAAEELYEEASALAKKMTVKTKEKQIHKLRLRYKAARYALEFVEASGLGEVTSAIETCKKRLKHFGAIQDAANQAELLQSLCKIHAIPECHTLYKERKRALKKLKKAFKIEY